MVRISSNIISMSEISENLPSKNIDGAVIQNLWMSYKQHSQNTSGCNNPVLHILKPKTQETKMLWLPQSRQLRLTLSNTCEGHKRNSTRSFSVFTYLL